MITLNGIGASPGTAEGMLLCFRRRVFAGPPRPVGTVEQEKERFHTALRQADIQLQQLCRDTAADADEACAQVFEIHRMMLQDQDYLQSVEELIEQKEKGAEYAVKETSRIFSNAFLTMESATMQARSADIQDVSSRLLRILRGEEEKPLSLPFPVILAADDLRPSETVQLDKKKLLAIVTSEGSRNSHTAILARTMGIPAIVRLGDVFTAAMNGKRAAVDGSAGTLWIDPTDAIYEIVRAKSSDLDARRQQLQQYKGLPSVTKDGVSVRLMANVGSVEDCEAAMENDAEGVGLFRTEFQYLGASAYPGEEELFRCYRAAVETMKGRPVTFRTLDIGADKQAPYLALPEEANPAMGIRAVRLYLARRDLMRTQLRALYRASVYGQMAIMIPMIDSVWELQEVRVAARLACRELGAEGIPFNPDVPIGTMIETPAAALISDELAKTADFFSIGTNDLTQYTLAADRQNGAVSPFYDARHSAVLRLIRMAAENAKAAGIPVSVCGDLATDLTMTDFFLSCGVTTLSVPPKMVLPLRERVRSLVIGRQEGPLPPSGESREGGA